MCVSRKEFLKAGTAFGGLAAASALPAFAAEPSQVMPDAVPDLLTTFDGRRVSTAAQWEGIRVPELLKEFQDEEYGRRPVERPADLAFSIETPDSEMFGGKAVLKRIRVSYAGKYGKGGFSFEAVIPNVGRPVPSFVLFCTENQRKKHIDIARPKLDGFWPVEEIASRGYAAIVFSNGEIAPDRRGAGMAGVFSCFEDAAKGRPTNSWGALSAWAWGASRVMDWIETEPLLDARHVAVIGHSRGGKTALVAAAFDRRFAMACSNDSGCSGAKLNHIDLPRSQNVQQIFNFFPHWFCANYVRRVNSEKQWRIDQHCLVALIAPRLVCIGSAKGDVRAGPEGEYWSAALASPAWELYGKRGLVSDGFPSPETPLQRGRISYHLRTGGHALTAYDWKCYMDFADRHGWRGNTTSNKEGWSSQPSATMPTHVKMELSCARFPH